MNIVVTGGAGFIGSALVKELLARNHKVVAVVRSSTNRARHQSVSGLHVVASDSWNSPELVSTLAAHRPDSFVHCAWQGVGGAERNAAWQITANLRLTVDALELARTIGCSQWVSLGSQAEYGNLNQRISEDCPSGPTTLYGKAKLIATETAQMFCEAVGIKAAVLRIFSTYGPGDSPAWFIPYIIGELRAGRAPKLTACEQKWDYLYIEDAARAIASAVESRIIGIFNLGSGVARPLLDTVEIIRNELGTAISPEYGAVPYRSDQVMWLEADIARLSNSTGWRPETSLESGIKKTVAFALSNHHHD